MKTGTKTKHSPMMQQWDACKKKAKNALLFFRLGDFYEAFYDDAHVISKQLSLTLTQRQKIPMCGVPFHASENYIDKLLAKGFKVAIAEQMEDPKNVKGIVKREIVRIVSPGTLMTSTLLKDKTNNFFASIAQVGKIYGLSFIDLTTGEFHTLELEDKQQLLDELFRLKPSEILISNKFLHNYKTFIDELNHSMTFVLNTKDDWYFDHHLSADTLIKHFKVETLDSFGLKGMIAAINASGALLSYFDEELLINLNHIKTIQTDQLSNYMALDYSCLRNLEILEPLSSTPNSHTLLSLLDKTKTPMGGRMLAYWIKHPLLCLQQIHQRQEAVQELLDTTSLMDTFSLHFNSIKDLERLLIRLSGYLASPKDLIALKLSLEKIPFVKQILSSVSSSLLKQAFNMIFDSQSCYKLIDEALVDSPPFRISDGGAFKDGYDKELDEIRQINKNSKKWIANYQNTLREQTNIKNLKVGFTRVFGYYIEVSKGQISKSPEYFQRRQTLVNAERFITDELKNFEQKIFTAEEKIKAIETQLFNDLITKLSRYSDEIISTAKAIATIDTLLSLATCAKLNRYVKPLVDESNRLYIEQGRHPILEKSLPMNKYIPNDTKLDDKERLFLITGPNMSGKSTYIRQVALITIMAQIGSYVPAHSAHIGLIDRVFCRIGASDDISRGQSTFMVEMCETANILHNCTSHSLIILDEIGRGTSTYDGISIAWAVVEFLLTTKNKQAKTLFATHYWELTEIEKKIAGAVNYNVAVKETDDGIVFLHKIIRGGTDKSYGIHVAKLAKLPFNVIKKAEKMLTILETNANRQPHKNILASQQIYLFDPNQINKKKKSDIEEEIKNLDINNMTPIEAQKNLSDMQKKILYEL